MATTELSKTAELSAMATAEEFILMQSYHMIYIRIVEILAISRLIFARK